MDEHAVLAVTRRWVTDFVIGLNLCPFARKVSDAGLIRYVATDVAEPAALLRVLAAELTSLAAAPRAAVETTLLVHPLALPDFRDYHDFFGPAERLVRALGLRGVIQIAGFHPDYQFAGTAPGDVENYTNRSPYPMLHLLREDAVTEVAGDPDRLLDIPRRNVELLTRMGRREVLARLAGVTGAMAGP